METLPFDTEAAMQCIPSEPSPLSTETPKRFADLVLRDDTLILGGSAKARLTQTFVLLWLKKNHGDHRNKKFFFLGGGSCRCVKRQASEAKEKNEVQPASGWLPVKRDLEAELKKVEGVENQKKEGQQKGSEAEKGHRWEERGARDAEGIRGREGHR